MKKPVPGDNEVLVKIHASTVTRGDVIIRKLPFIAWIPFRLFGYKRKKITGHEFAGEIEAVGKDIKTFIKGDPVFGTTTGLSSGGNAEYVCVPEEWKQGAIARKPVNISYEEAAALPIGGMTALQLLRKGKIRSGQSVLIYGASGSVGTYAVQLAKHFGAEVTGVCSTMNLDMVRDIGADYVIDYTKDDFTRKGLTYDVIFDTVRKIRSSQCRGSLRRGGVFVSTRSPTSEKNEYLDFLRTFVEEGTLRPVIDKRFPLELTAEAHRYVDKGHKRGNVVITVASPL
jgi:NADPH:quinone reductase-like Zn-dependent oxidoreductase